MDQKYNYETVISDFLSLKQYKKLSIKAALIDMDGVLFDSMKGHTWAWHKALSEQNIEVDRNEFYAHEGRTGAATINLIFERELGRKATETEIEYLYRLKSEYFNSLPDSGPMPGAQQLMETLKMLEIKPVLVTGSGQKSLLSRLQAYYPNTFSPDNMVTAFDVKFGKPHPEPYLMGLKKGNVLANEAIVIENAPMGVQAGVAAGVFTIAVNTGPLDNVLLYQAGANLLYPSMQNFSSQFIQLYNSIRK